MPVSKHKCTVYLQDEARDRLFRLVWLLNQPPEEILQSAFLLSDDAPVDEARVNKLEDALREGQRQFDDVAGRLSTVQSRYAGTKLTLFERFQENRPLVVNLAGVIAENQSLRHALGLPDQNEQLNQELDRLFQGYIKRDVRKLVDTTEVPEESGL